MWSQDGISLKTKMRLYHSLVMSVVMYEAESWTCSDHDYAKLNFFLNKNLRSLLGRNRDEISNKDKDEVI